MRDAVSGRARLTMQLLAEGVVLAVIGGVGGLAVAWVGFSLLARQLPATLPRLAAMHIDRAALGLAALLTIALALVVGLLPGWRAGSATLAASLRGGRRLAGSGRHLARATLVVSEVALAMMLLVGATLLARSVTRLFQVDIGFDAAHLLTLQVQSTGPKYPDSVAVFNHHDLVRAAVRAIPGVEAAGNANQLPLGGNIDRYGIRAQDKPLANPELAPSADRYAVSPDFFQTMRIPLRRGRSFTDADNRDAAPPVAIVSASLATKIWGGEDAIGKRIQLGGKESPWRTVIGVVGNVHHRSLDSRETNQIYLPERQWQFADQQIALVVGTIGHPTSVAATVRSVVQALDPTQPITRVAAMEDVIASSTAQRRFALLLFLSFSAIALLLAAFGIYGVLAGSVTERTREIGVRAALGATPPAILRLILGQGAILAGAGLAVGVAGALALGRFLEGLLYGVTARDPLTLAIVLGTLALVAILACLLPARRALRVDPMTALRAD